MPSNESLPEMNRITTPYAIRSSFRDEKGRQVKSDGLEWDLLGESVMRYVASKDTNGLEMRRGIVHAHNRWCFAKDVPFQRIDDMEKVTLEGPFVDVEWKKNTVHKEETTTRSKEDIAKLLQEHPSAASVARPSAEVWINGDYVDDLSPDTMTSILETVSKIESRSICMKQSLDGHIIRLDRYFRGGLYHKQDIFDHIMDNLIALADVQILNNSQTLIGTATLPDWIMGGMLTSRLYIHERSNGNILFLRPLYDDDIQTSDRRFELHQGVDDNMIALVQVELERLRYLATLPLPPI